MNLYIIKLQHTLYLSQTIMLTLSSRVSFTGLPLCVHVNIGRGNPETSHSNFIFCPALAIILDNGTTNAGISVGSEAKNCHINIY